MPGAEGADEVEKQLAQRDELLQVLYWLRGESIAKNVAATELTRWMSIDAMEIHSLLVSLTEAELVEVLPNTADVRFRLTESGVKEGGRRFADEFAELTRPGHFACADPNCECKLTGNPAHCVQQR